MDIDDIKELIRILDESSIIELTWEEDDERLILRKAPPAPPAPPAWAPPAVPPAGMAVALGAPGSPAPGQETAAAPAVAAAGPGGAAAAAGVPAAGAGDRPAARDDDRFVTVTSPMVGTFYRAPAPDEAPYVQVGDRVEVGQPLCIIEAMKLMNEIESEVAGRIREILVANGEPVEYGQALFIIERE